MGGIHKHFDNGLPMGNLWSYAPPRTQALLSGESTSSSSSNGQCEDISWRALSVNLVA